MGNDDNGTLVIHEKILKPLNGPAVKSVGGLVQKDYLRPAEKRPGKQNLHLFAFVQGTHEVVQDIPGKPEALQKSCRVGLGLPSAKLGEFSFQIRGSDAVLLCKILLGVYLLFFSGNVVKMAVALHDGIKNRKFFVGKVILLQNRKPAVGPYRDFALGGLKLA